MVNRQALITVGVLLALGNATGTAQDEHIPIQVLWENQGSFSGTVWGIPIRVKE